MSKNQVVDSMEDKELFERFKSMGASIFDAYKLPHEFSVENISKLEKQTIKFIKEAKKTKEPIYSLTVAVIGYLLGETIIRNIEGAKWVTDGDEIWDYYIEHPAPEGSTFQAFPFIRAVRFFQKHKTYGLTFYLNGVKFMSEVGLSNL